MKSLIILLITDDDDVFRQQGSDSMATPIDAIVVKGSSVVLSLKLTN